MGDVFVFPEGLVHYQRNVDNREAFAIVSLNSQNPGVITIADAVFGSHPEISAEVLAQAFQVHKKTVKKIKNKFK